MSTGEKIISVLKESRMFEPPAEFSRSAHIKSMEEYQELWNFAKDHPEEFWGQQAKEHLEWFEPFDRVLDWNPPHVEWFGGGKLNASYNCLDRHAKTWRKNKAALIWEGEPGDSRVLTYGDLLREVCKFANAMKKLGIAKGDRVTIYMPMVPELVIAVLACAHRAPHSVVFGGFSSEALSDRNNDVQSKLVITADGGWRRGKIVPLKDNVDASLSKSPTVKHVIALRRTGQKVSMQPGRDHWWHELVSFLRLIVRLSRWIAKTRSSSSTLRGAQASPREFCTRPGDTSSEPLFPRSMSSISRKKTHFGAQPTSVG